MDGSAGLVVVAAVLAAAVLHASWNAIAKHATDQAGLFARTSLVGVLLSLPLMLVVDPPDRPAWPWLAGSIGTHVVYNLGLIAAYRLGDFNLTYPLARGLGPLVVAVVAVSVLDEPMAATTTAGVLLIAGAIGVLGLTPWHRVREHTPAVLAAIGTGITIAVYTLLDGIGVRRSGGSFGYTVWLLGTHGLGTVVVLAVGRRFIRVPVPVPVPVGVGLAGGAVEAAPGPVRRWGLAALACVMSITAYGLVLWAQTRGALAAVAAMRETSVVVAAVIGVVLFKEPMGRLRIAAAATVALGVVLLAL